MVSCCLQYIKLPLAGLYTVHKRWVAQWFVTDKGPGTDGWCHSHSESFTWTRSGRWVSLHWKSSSASTDQQRKIIFVFQETNTLTNLYMSSLTPWAAVPRGLCLLQRGEKPCMLNVEMCWLLRLINETSTLGTINHKLDVH